MKPLRHNWKTKQRVVDSLVKKINTTNMCRIVCRNLKSMTRDVMFGAQRVVTQSLVTNEPHFLCCFAAFLIKFHKM